MEMLLQSMPGCVILGLVASAAKSALIYPNSKASQNMSTHLYLYGMGYGHLPRVVKRVDIFVPLTGFNSRGKLGFT